jgi:hypothetical protein
MASSQAWLAAPRLGEILQRSNRSVAEKPGPGGRRPPPAQSDQFRWQGNFQGQSPDSLTRYLP